MSTAIEVVESGGRLRGGLSPLRRAVLAALAEPGSATEVAARLGESRQRVGYHVRELEKGGLVELVELRPRRGCVERVVRAASRAVVLDPEVLGDLGAAGEQDRFAAETLLAHAARAVRDVGRMRREAGRQGKRLVTFAIEAEVGFERPADVRRFAEALALKVAELAAEYDHGAAKRRYRVIVGGHPAPKPEEGS